MVRFATHTRGNAYLAVCLGVEVEIGGGVHSHVDCPYDLISEDGKKLNSKQIYPLSLKDMCTINFIPDMIKSRGINSFKIEGRMKSLEYLKTVTSIYRKYIDMALANKNYHVNDSDIKNC